MDSLIDELNDIELSITNMINSIENESQIIRTKNKFDLVLNELKNVKLVEGEIPREVVVNEMRLQPVDSNKMCSRYYSFLGFKNELSSSLLYIEPDKWMGPYKEELTLVKASAYYDLYSESTNEVFLTLPIHDIYLSVTKELYFIAQKPNCYEIRKKLKEYRSLPRRKQNHIINIKSGKCSCFSYKKFKFCKHYYIAKNERTLLRNYLTLVLMDKIGKPLALQISSSCNLY